MPVSSRKVGFVSRGPMAKLSDCKGPVYHSDRSQRRRSDGHLGVHGMIGTILIALAGDPFTTLELIAR